MLWEMHVAVVDFQLLKTAKIEQWEETNTELMLWVQVSFIVRQLQVQDSAANSKISKPDRYFWTESAQTVQIQILKPYCDAGLTLL